MFAAFRPGVHSPISRYVVENIFSTQEMRKTMSDVADLLKISPENGHTNKQARNSMLLTASPLGRSRTNTRSIGDLKKDSISLDHYENEVKPPAMELAADLV